MENINEALCAQRKTGRTGFQIVRYFQELIFMSPILIFPRVLKKY